MQLSELVYLCIKNVIYYDDPSFTKEEYLKGTFDNAPDYATNIHNVFSPLNEAISRLSDLERIPYEVEDSKVNLENKVIFLEDLTNEVKEVISIAECSNDGSYKRLAYRPLGINKVHILDYFNTNNSVLIEYKIDIPMFNTSYISYSYDDETFELKKNKDIDLKKYGITDSMCNYIIEYVTGRLYEPISADIANMHVTRAEQYFTNIKPVASAFPQQVVRKMYRVGE